jgi:hypothetical protein
MIVTSCPCTISLWSHGHHSLPHIPSSHVLLMPNSKHLTHGINNLVSLITKTKLGLSHMDVTKIDRDVVYIIKVAHIYCKLLLPMFHLFLQTYVVSVFIWMLRMFHIFVCKCFYLDVAYVFTMIFKCFLGVFTSVLDACFKCFICLQTTYVASVASECFKSKSGVASLSLPCVASPRCLLFWASAMHPPPTSLSSRCWWHSWQAWAPCEHVKRCRKRQQARASGRPVHPDVRTLAKPDFVVQSDLAPPTNYIN